MEAAIVAPVSLVEASSGEEVDGPVSGVAIAGDVKSQGEWRIGGRV